MKTELTIHQIPIAELIPADYNPRHWSDAARKHLTESLDEFGFMQPLVANSNAARRGVVIGGNFKLSIAKEKGITHLPVVWVDLDLAKEKELNLRLNKNQGEFNLDLLAEFDQSLLALVGFESRELDKIFKEDEDDFDEDAALADIKIPTAVRGDIFLLGRHRVMCGDATSAADVEKLRGGVLADMVWTDPPYNVNYTGRGAHTSTTIQNDNMSETDFRQLLAGAFANYAASLKRDGGMYVCYASRTHREFEDALNGAGFEVKQQIIWVKKVASMGWGDYRWKHEPILYCHLKGAGKVNFYGDRSQYTEWDEEPTDQEIIKWVKAQVKKEEAGDSTVWRMHRESKYDHPTQKPVKLVAIAIRNSSKRDDIILDLFGGSGSTLIAADQINRTAQLMELDPKYVDVIVNRWEKLTNQKATKL